MGKKIKLTPAEWEIMNTIWEMDGDCSVRDVLESTYPNGEKAYTTIQAFMNILERKKVLRRSKIGLVNFYSPTRTKREVTQAEMSTILSRVFGGSVAAMTSSLMSLDNMDLKEIKNLKSLLIKKEKELKGNKDG